VTVPGAHPTRRMAIAAGLLLAVLTALAVWISGRWLERPHRPPGTAAGAENAHPAAGPTDGTR
jgi:hypothetical protein